MHVLIFIRRIYHLIKPPGKGGGGYPLISMGRGVAEAPKLHPLMRGLQVKNSYFSVKILFLDNILVYSDEPISRIQRTIESSIKVTINGKLTDRMDG